MSGGQKQRIVIARCLLRQAKLLLFDEPTSALDTHNEQVRIFSMIFVLQMLLSFYLFIQLIQQALKQSHLNENSTIIIVAHRLSTIRECDMICVFNSQGQIIESGTHETLVSLHGVYYRMTKAIFT